MMRYKIKASLIQIFISMLLTAISTSSFAITNICTKPSSQYNKKVYNKFKQNPLLLVEAFLNLPYTNSLKDIDSKNLLIKSSFDVNRIYKANINNFKSKALSQNLFDWIRTQYFGNLEKNLYSKNNQLFNENADLFNRSEKLQMSKNLSFATNIAPYKCNKEERRLLGCKSAYLVKAQTAAAVSCKKESIQPAFESHFYLTYSRKYGFKIIDIAISGKRIVLDSIKHMMSLKNKGFNKDAIALHISTLSSHPNTFKLPKKQINTKRFLAKFKRLDPDRLPSSL